MSKKALITGISGQDGSYLTEYLIEKGYEICGILRRYSIPENQTTRIEKVWAENKDKISLIYGDITDLASLIKVIKQFNPDEIYNLAAQSHVRISFDQPFYTTLSCSIGTLNILEAVKEVKPDTKIYQAGSSEMFGNESDPDGFRRETTKMSPVSPYGCAKLYSHNLVKCYRSSYNLFASNGILFNHESPRRGINFVTNKVIDGAIKIYKGDLDFLALGNLEATRDWGHAKDYTKAMHLILQQDKPDDFVCAMGESHSVRQLCELVFSYFGMNYDDYVILDKRYLRPTELDDLKGDSSKLRSIGWNPTYTFESMILEMIEAKLNEIKV